MFSDNQIWKRRSMILHFAVLNLKVKYRNSFLGFLWTFLEPLLLMAVIYTVFSNLLGGEIEHFPLYLLLGLITWHMFSGGTNLALESIMGKGRLMTSIYIPIEVPVISSAVTTLIKVSLELLIFGLFLAWFQFVPPATIVLLPLAILLGFLLTLAVSFPLSVLNIKYRDLQFIWGVVIHAGFFLNPIFYERKILPDFLDGIIQFIPTAYIMDFARGVTLYGRLPSQEYTMITLGVILSVFAAGYMIFYSVKRRALEEL